MGEINSYCFKALHFVVKKPQSDSHVHKKTVFDLGKRRFQALHVGAWRSKCIKIKYCKYNSIKKFFSVHCEKKQTSNI